MKQDNHKELIAILDKLRGHCCAGMGCETSPRVEYKDEAAQAIEDFYRNKILEVTKKPTTLPKTNHLETVKQGINFYHKTMQKRITAQFNSGGSDEDK